MLVLSMAGAVGAVVRYVVSGRVQHIAASPFPAGTTMVNVAGAFAMGLLAGGRLDSWWVVAGLGFLGGFTTFSTWMIESLRLMGSGEEARALFNLAGMLGVGLGAAALATMIVS